MAREYFNAYHSYLEAMEPLNDAERGRLFTACLKYSMTGEVPQLSGNERFVFPSLKGQIDRDVEKYEEFTRKQAQNGQKGGRPRKPSETQKTQAFFEKPKKAKEKEKEKEKEKAKENTGDTPCNPPVVLPAIDGFSPEMTDKLREWLMYKQERREGYKAIGLKNLLAMVRGKIEEHGEQAVLMRISEAMASGWVGMNLDKMPVSRAKTGGFADVKGEW